MKRQKYYFDATENEPEHCHTMKWHENDMREQGISERVLIEAKPSFGTGYFYCTEYDDVGEVGQGCGKECKAYKPRNGKNGRCRFSHHLYEQTDKRITIKAISSTMK